MKSSRFGRAFFVAVVFFAVTAQPQLATRAERDFAVTGVYKLPSFKLTSLGAQPISEPALLQARRNGLKHTDLPSIGSGLARAGNNEFCGITDRGPNGEVDTAKGTRRTFPLPDFCPAIVRFRLTNEQIQIVRTIPLRDGHGKPLTGLSNLSTEERLYASADARSPLPVDPNGVDPEAIRVLPDGRFLIAEEYSPSVLVVSAVGEVLVRYTPAAKPLTNASYPVKAILPAVLSQRRHNRGFESLALSADGRTAYAILQSPAGDAEDKRMKQSRVARALRLDVSDPLHARVTGHFLVPLSRAADYGPAQKQPNVKLNDADWLAPDKLLVLETGAGFARLIVVDFAGATNLLGRPDENALTFELVGGDLSKLPITPARTEVWLATAGLSAIGSPKLEGLAILGPDEIALANDNDFGLGDNATGEPSMAWTLRLHRPLPFLRP